jgi:serine/threonine protein phosphatase 1
MNKIIPYKTLPPNLKGKDYYCGDLHGCFEILENTLSAMGFDPCKDRLFCTGDLINRGPQSARVLEFLNQPWFFSVLGNHEMMVVNAWMNMKSSRLKNGMDLKYAQEYGGDWLANLSSKEMETIATRLTELPLNLLIEGERKIAVVHSNIPGGKDIAFALRFLSNMPLYFSAPQSPALLAMLWDNNQPGEPRVVAGIDRLVCGHTGVKEIIHAGNISWLDLSVYRTGALGVIDSNEFPFQEK